jgi:TolA-binding protein
LKTCLSFIAISIFLSSCSWLERVERDLVSDDKPKKNSKYVSRDQYEQLLSKYEDLNRKYNEMKEGPVASNSLLTDLQKKPLTTTSSEGVAVETVEVFNQAPSTNPAAPIVMDDKNVDPESALNRYHQALSLKDSKPADALRLFQSLENSGPDSLKARAKFQIGDMFLKQNEYDLALQSFDDVITKNAHSGIVIEALKGALTCADKLGLSDKKEQYQSLLKDVFGSET